MQPYTTRTLIKNKLFLAALTICILSSIASLCLFIDFLVHLDSCIAWNACSEQSSGYYTFCVKDGYKYCCGGWGSDYYSCGNYINNCRKKNDGFIDCDPVYKGQIATMVIALVFGVGMVVIAIIHNRQQRQYPQNQETYALNSGPDFTYNRAQ